MDVSILLEKVENNGYRATALVPGALVVEAPTRDEAVKQIRDKINERIARGEVIQIQVPTVPETNPWLAAAGVWRDHPDIDSVVKNMEEYRREVNEDPDRL